MLPSLSAHRLAAQTSTPPGAVRTVGEWLWANPPYLAVALVVASIPLGYLIYQAVVKGRPVRIFGFELGPRDAAPPVLVIDRAPSTSSIPATSGDAWRASSDEHGVLRPDTRSESLYWQQARHLAEVLEGATRYTVAHLDIEFEVDSTYGVTSRTTRRIAAVDRPVMALCLKRGSKDTQLDRFEDLRLHASDGRARTLPWIPTEDLPNGKGFIVFFRDAASPGGEPVEITTRDSWAGAAHRLSKVGGHDTYSFGLPAAAVGDLPSMRLSITLPVTNGAQYRISCEQPALELTVPDPRTHSPRCDLRFGPEALASRGISLFVVRVG